jgi:hypothetical protein
MLSIKQEIRRGKHDKRGEQGLVEGGCEQGLVEEGGEGGGREKNSWAGERWAPVPDRTDTVTGRV